LIGAISTFAPHRGEGLGQRAADDLGQLTRESLLARIAEKSSALAAGAQKSRANTNCDDRISTSIEASGMAISNSVAKATNSHSLNPTR